MIVNANALQIGGFESREMSKTGRTAGFLRIKLSREKPLLQGLEFTSGFLLSMLCSASLVESPEKMKKPFSHLFGFKKRGNKRRAFL
jgi:hypothetical protein